MPEVRHTRWRRLLAAGAIPLAAWLVASLSGCGGASATGHGRPPSAPPLISLFEADPELHADPAGTLDRLRGLGVQTVRVFMPWGSLGSLGAMAPDPLSPRPPAGFDAADPAAYPAPNWRVYDSIVRAARAHGMQVDLTLGPPPPLWARGPGDPGHPAHPQWRFDTSAFGAFVRAVATRYSGSYRPAGAGSPLPRVSFWAIWNEPNFGPMIAPQTEGGVDVSPSIYRRLADAAWSSLQAAGHGHDTILVGELAPFGHALGGGPGAFGYMVPLRFLRSLYCVDGALRPLRGSSAAAVGCPSTAAASSAFPHAHPALFAATGLAVHPYSQGPPTVSVPGEPDYANLPALPHVEQTLDGIFTAYGQSRRMPLYSTEFGVHTNPPETVFGTVSPAAAARDLNQAEYISWRDPRLRSYAQYLLSDPPGGNFATGLLFASGRPKPGLPAYRLPLFLPRQRASAGQPLEVWGAVRPARYATREVGERVRIQFRAAGGGRFETVRTISLAHGSVYFDVQQAFRASGAVRLAYSLPDGQTIFSRTETISVA